MLFVPKKGILRVQHNMGEVGTATPGTSVTSGSPSTAKGTPAEIFSSTSFDAYWVRIYVAFAFSQTGASESCMDILTGAATEEILIPNLLCGYAGQGNTLPSSGPKVWEFPLYIPAGSRIAVQTAGVLTSTAWFVWMFLYGGDAVPMFRVGSKVTTYGMGTVPNGTTITPGASGAEDDAWVAMTASTTADHFAFVPSFQPTGDSSISARRIQVDIGLGTAGSEEQIGAGYLFSTDTNESMGGPFSPMPTFTDVPSGTRLAMRASNSGTNDGGYNGVIHAVS